MSERRTALVTGSGQNIGRACALGLARDGFNVVVNGLNKREQAYAVAEEITELGVDAMVVMGNVGDRVQCRRIYEQAAEKFGYIDVLVNNAAIRPSTPFLELDEAEWTDVLNVDLNAAFYLAQACLPKMVEGGWGRIINFAGMNAIHGYNGRAHVSVAKHGSWGLVKSLAKEFGSRGITANIVSPGPTASDHDDPAMTEHIKSQTSRIPIGRLGEPDEIASIVRMLASDGGAFINGQMIQVNGGTET